MLKGYGEFLSNLRSIASLSLEELARLAGTSKSTLSRLENNDIAQPYKGGMRKGVITLAQLLCTSRRETERYLELAGIDRVLLTDTEEIQLGFIPRVATGSPDELTTLEQLAHIYGDVLEQLEAKEIEIGISSSPPTLKLKMQEYANNLQEVQKRLDILTNKKELGALVELQMGRVHYAEALEGKIDTSMEKN